MIRARGAGMGEVMALGRAKRLGLLLAATLLAGVASLPLRAQTETVSPPVATPAPTTETPASATQPPAPAASPEAGTPVDVPLRGTIADPAAPAAAEPVPTAADLEEIEASMSLSQERIDALKAEIAEMEGDRTRQNAALIAA
ncbi:MAG TPA: hypothetical protein VL017_11765, partial [Devosia sp.]|nr:hypothetical protein [Devosia sp.]